MQPIVEQIKRLAEQQADLAGFYRQAIESIADSFDALAAAVWDCSSLPFHAICQYSRDPDRPVHVGISQHHHIEMLQRAADQDEAVRTLVNPDSENQNSVVMICRVQRGRNHDLIEVFFPCDRSEEYYASKKSDLEACCAAVSESLAAKSFSSKPLQSALSRSTTASWSPAQFDEFATNIHGSIDFRETCYHIANESQALLGADRVSVVRFDRKAKTSAVSGLPKINRRANAIVAMERLCNAALPTAQALWYPDPGTEIMPQIQKPLDEYLAAGVTRSLVLVPILEQPPESPESPEQATRKTAPRVIGGLVLENFAGQWQRKTMHEPVTQIGRHAATAYRNAYAHRSLFLYPLWRGLGQLTGPRILPRTLLVVALLAVMVAALLLIPSKLVVSGEGRLVPQLRRNVFAQVDGRVETVHVIEGDAVLTGDLLVTLESSELEIGLADIQHEMDLARQQIEALDRSRLTESGSLSGEQSDIERSSLMQRLESLEKRREIYVEQIGQLAVRSPLEGQVISSDLQRHLLDRPIRKGQLLLEVAATAGQWVIEMDLPDRRIGHLQRARKASGEPLRVSFILAADPGRQLTGTVSDVSLATQVTQESGHTIRVTIVPDDADDIDIRQVRTDVSVRIECGDCSLGYAWFHDVSELIQSKVLFYLR